MLLFPRLFWKGGDGLRLLSEGMMRACFYRGFILLSGLGITVPIFVCKVHGAVRQLCYSSVIRGPEHQNGALMSSYTFV